jgi:ribosomal protein L16/L10AE
LYNFRRSLKKYYGFKKSKVKKVWLFLHKNYPLTKKSKNARMGKGKGTIARYCSRVLQNHNLFEFSGFNINELISLRKIFNKKVGIPIKINTSFFSNKSYKYTNLSEKFFIFRKYQK